MHNAYLIALTALFLTVFVIMIHTLASHARRSPAPATKKFGGPAGRGQWLWALVPIAIVAGVGFALVDLSSLRLAGTGKTIAVAAAPAHPGR